MSSIETRAPTGAHETEHVSIFLDLPLPPPTNGLFANKRKGGRHITKRYAAWREEAGWMIQAARCGSIPGPYRFTIMLPLTMRGDVDGRLKAPLDLLVTHGVTDDDRNCVSVRAERTGKVFKDRCRVIVESAQ